MSGLPGSVIYICAHSSDGAMGIVVNRLAGDIDFPKLLVKLDVIPADQRIDLQSDARTVQVLKGGPVENPARLCAAFGGLFRRTFHFCRSTTAFA